MSLPQRIASKIDEPDENGCRRWRGYIYPNGYGQVWADGTTRRAHRVVYEALMGPIPRGLQIDHLCRNRACVAVEHLRVVTHRENTLAEGSLCPSAVNAAKTECAHGHEFTEENTVIRRNGWRSCRTCQYEAHRRWRARSRSARRAAS